jgi:hypothetical protein
VTPEQFETSREVKTVIPDAKEAMPEWEQIYQASLDNRRLFKVGVGIYDLLVGALFIWSVHSGRPAWAVVCELLTSQIPLLAMRFAWEDRKNPDQPDETDEPTGWKTLDPRMQSWAFLADFVGLAPMQAFAAKAYPLLPHNALFNGEYWWAWVAMSVVGGCAASWVFRKGEAKSYDPLRYNSFTKLLHNGVAFTVLATMIIHTLVPIVILNWSAAWPYSGWVLAFFLVWVAGVVGDMIRGNLPDGHPLKLKGSNLHPRPNARGRRIRRDLGVIPTYYEYKSQHPEFGNDWYDILQPPRLGRMLVQIGRPLVPRKWRPQSTVLTDERQRPMTGYDDRCTGPPDPDDPPNKPG